MKAFLVVLAGLILATGLGGCAPSRPLSDSEFRGFCYTSIGRRADCDTIAICDEYDAEAMAAKLPSKQACAEACLTTYNRLYEPNLFNGCSSTVLMAYNWCMKYCNTNYVQ